MHSQTRTLTGSPLHGLTRLTHTPTHFFVRALLRGPAPLGQPEPGKAQCLPQGDAMCPGAWPPSENGGGGR